MRSFVIHDHPFLFDVEVLGETEKAWKVRIEEWVGWMPKSQCVLSEDKTAMRAKAWLLEAKRKEDRNFPIYVEKDEDYDCYDYMDPGWF